MNPLISMGVRTAFRLSLKKEINMTPILARLTLLTAPFFIFGSLTFGSSAHAVVAGPDIRSAQIAPQTTDSLGKITAGTIQVNRTENTITLDARRGWSCPAHALCSMVMPPPLHIVLSLTKISIGKCGEIIYVGSATSGSPIESETQIQVIDYSQVECRAIAATVIEYSVRSQSDGTPRQSQLAAGQLFTRMY